MLTCAVCGLALPDHARFCARCGTPLSRGGAGGSPPVWVQVLFWIGAAIAFVAAAVYGVVLAVPGLASQSAASQGIDAGQLRSVATVVAVTAAAVFVAQSAASIGLMLGRPWARAVATVVCMAWALTCLGLPLAILALTAIWRPRASVTAPRSP